ncbi:MAG: alpha-N-arabinofuranosidase [Lachnospiraceae bacterium]|nr:alpha-N-arabinofuranosidase [Lachnospiraceae bacterium]
MHHLIIHPDVKKSRIEKEVYGNFSEHLGRCIYGGVYVGENSDIPNVNGMRTDVVEALKEMKLPVLRWPGGCFADEYHWKDGIGPKENRKKMINTHWGGVVEDNSFGTHEFFELCRQIGCEPYVNGNVGSGSVQEMNEWIEYMTFDGLSPLAKQRADNGSEKPWKLKYFAVGNENWGCGGNMRPEFYADQFRRYATYCRNYGDNKLFKIACGPSEDDQNWTEVLMKEGGRLMNGLSMHYYTVPHDWRNKGSATDFNEEDWYATLNKALKIGDIIRHHKNIMDRYDPEGNVALVVDEWGTWYDVEPGTNPGFLYQQNTMRDALVAGLTLNIFNENSDRVRMANIAQLANVLQSVVLTEGAKMVKTPTYHVFRMLSSHQGATLLGSVMDQETIGEAFPVPDVTESASMAEDGTITVSLNNLSVTEEKTVEIALAGKAVTGAEGEILTGPMNAHNTFDAPDTVQPSALSGLVPVDGKLTLTLPPVSVCVLHLQIS